MDTYIIGIERFVLILIILLFILVFSYDSYLVMILLCLSTLLMKFIVPLDFMVVVVFLIFV